MSQTLIYSAKVCPKVTKVKNAGGNYQVGSFQVGDACGNPFKVGERIIAPGGYFGKVTSVHKKITITWENGLSGEYTPKQMQAWNYKKFLEEKEAIECNLDTPASLQESPVLTLESKQQEQQTSSLQNYSLKTIPTLKQSSDIDFPIFPSTATSGTITPNLENLTSTQLDFLVPAHPLPETVQDLTTQNQNSGLKPYGALPMAVPTLSSSKILQGLSIEDYEQFLGDSEWLAIAGMIRKSYQSRNSEVFTKGNDYLWLPTPTTYPAGSTGCRPAGANRLEQKLRPHIAKTEKLHPAVPGWMMGFPPGWTEQVLGDTGEILSIQPPLTLESAATSTKDAAVLTSTVEPLALNKQRSPLNESVTSPISSQQFKAITLHQPWAYLVGRYKCFETRSWPTNYRGKIAIHAAKQQKDTKYWYEQLKDLLPPLVELPFGSIVAIADLADCILMTEEFINQQSETELRCGNWKIGRYAWKLENVQILPEPIPTKGKQGLWNIELPFALTQPAAGIAPQSLITKSSERERASRSRSVPQGREDKSQNECTQQLNDVRCPSCESPLLTLNNGCGVCGWTPVSEAGARTRATNFLEETESATTFTEKPKHRQRKGCLYKYIENKKLKNGSIASYPRVIGHRNPDNPTHWRWGFNWEEKVDGEWKGRSIGSIPVGAIALIQSMQNEGVSLEEIIGFIKRAKAKK